MPSPGDRHGRETYTHVVDEGRSRIDRVIPRTVRCSPMTDEPHLSRFVVRPAPGATGWSGTGTPRGRQSIKGIQLSDYLKTMARPGPLVNCRAENKDLAITRENVCPVTGLVSKNFSDFKTMRERFSRSRVAIRAWQIAPIGR